jgi:hypothetical protein
MLNMMFNKLKLLKISVMSFVYTLGVPAALAAPVESQDPSAFGEKLVEVFKAIGMPVGGAILFISVCIVAVNMMIHGVNPDKRANAMSGLLWVAGGGIILGAAMFIAGVILGTGEQLG